METLTLPSQLSRPKTTPANPSVNPVSRQIQLPTNSTANPAVVQIGQSYTPQEWPGFRPQNYPMLYNYYYPWVRYVPYPVMITSPPLPANPNPPAASSAHPTETISPTSRNNSSIEESDSSSNDKDSLEELPPRRKKKSTAITTVEEQNKQAILDVTEELINAGLRKDTGFRRIISDPETTERLNGLQRALENPGMRDEFGLASDLGLDIFNKTDMGASIDKRIHKRGILGRIIRWAIKLSSRTIPEPYRSSILEKLNL